MDGTWHICNHDFECYMATNYHDVDRNYQNYQCKKCAVFATNQLNQQLIIFVNPETNHPFVLSGRGESPDCENAKGINLNSISHHE